MAPHLFDLGILKGSTFIYPTTSGILLKELPPCARRPTTQCACAPVDLLAPQQMRLRASLARQSDTLSRLPAVIYAVQSAPVHSSSRDFDQHAHRTHCGIQFREVNPDKSGANPVRLKSSCRDIAANRSCTDREGLSSLANCGKSRFGHGCTP